MNNYLITIILTVYNTPFKELERCIFSILNQTNQNFKLIIIDDGSNADTASYLDNIANDKINIQVIHKNNSGVSDSRNFGINNTDTKYITFVDSDDTISFDFIEKCYVYCKKIDFDYLCANIEYNPVWKSQIKINSLLHINNPIDLYEIKKSMFELLPRKFSYNVNVSSCAKLYKTSILKTILFDNDISFGEDQLLNRLYISKINTALLVPDVFYIYFQNNFSATRKLIKNISFNDYKTFWDKMYELDKNEPEIDKQAWRVFELRMLNGFVNRACAANFDIPLSKSLFKVKEACAHPMIVDMLKNIKIFTIGISFINSINVIFLRLKMYWLFLLEKRLIYRFGLNKDKI